MGLSLDLSLDSEGNKFLSFEDDSSDYNVMEIGSNFNDFKILQILSGDKDNNFVAKVRSLKNNKTYSLKKIILSQNNFNIYQYTESLLNQLTKIKNPHIIKYYGYFQCNNVFYLIMEYMDNSDILGYIQAHQIFNKSIKEGEIWNILLACLSALDYLHKNNLGKMGLKLSNIFTNNKQNIKIGIFRDIISSGVFYPNEEVKLLGKYCYIMMESKNINCDDIDNNLFMESLDNKLVQTNNYSQVLKEIVNNMLKCTGNIDVSKLFKTVKTEYAKKYNKNTSIISILKCLYSYNRLNEHLIKNKTIIENDISKFIIYNLYLKTIEAFKNKQNNFNNIIDEYRRIFSSYFFKLDADKEIDPLLFLTFFLTSLDKESKKKNLFHQIYNEKKNNYINCSANDGDEEDQSNKKQMLSKFMKYSSPSMSSIISDLFFGFVKTKRNCKTCKNGYYSFSNYLYIAFDLSSWNSNEDFDLMKDGFDTQYNSKEFLSEEKTNKIYCDQCITYQTFVEFNRYYMFNNQLIICFIRGNNFKNKSKIIFSEKIDLQQHKEQDINSPHNFYLVGCINRIYRNNEEKFISYSRDPDPLFGNNFNINNINQNNVDEQVLILFYNSKDISG